MSMRGVGQRCEVDDIAGRVADGFAEHRLGALVDQRLDALLQVAEETGKTVPQVALNWLLRRPTVSSVIVGARDADQLRENLGAVGWELTAEHVTRLEDVSRRDVPYPYFPYYRQDGFARINPPAFA